VPAGSGGNAQRTEGQAHAMTVNEELARLEKMTVGELVERHVEL
jgi:hypothetical protein